MGWPLSLRSGLVWSWSGYKWGWVYQMFYILEVLWLFQGCCFCDEITLGKMLRGLTSATEKRAVSALCVHGQDTERDGYIRCVTFLKFVVISGMLFLWRKSSPKDVAWADLCHCVHEQDAGEDAWVTFLEFCGYASIVFLEMNACYFLLCVFLRRVYRWGWAH